MSAADQPGKRVRYSIAQRYPALWVSQAHRTLLPLLIIGVLEAVIGYALPPTVNPAIAGVIGIVCFLAAFVQGRTYQYYYYEENLGRLEAGKLYLLNVVVTLAQGLLLLIAPYAQHMRAVHDLPSKKAFANDVLTIRLANIDPAYVALVKMYLLEPAMRDGLYRYRRDLITEGENNPFIYQSVGYLGGYDDGWMQGFELHSIGPAEEDAESASPSDTGFVSQEAFEESYARIFYLDYETETPLDISKYDSAFFNVLAFRTISELDSGSYSALSDRAAPLLERYGLTNTASPFTPQALRFSNFRQFESLVMRLLDVRSFDTPYRPELPFQVYTLVLVYAPICAFLTVISRRYTRRIRGLRVPFWPLSLLMHLIFGILLFGIFFELFGNNTSLLIAFAATILLMAIVLFLTRRRQRLRDARMVLLQTLHFQLLTFLFIAVGLSAAWTRLTRSMEFLSIVALILLLHVVVLPIIRFYHAAQYRPGNA